MSILDSMPGIMAGAMGQTLFRAANVFSVSGRASDGRGGFTPTFVRHSCRALVVDYTDWKRAMGEIPAAERKIIILAATLAVPLKAGDIVEIKADPAGATWTARARRAPVPTLAAIGVANIALAPFTVIAAGTTGAVIGSAEIDLAAIGVGGAGAPIIVGALAVGIGEIVVEGEGEAESGGELDIGIGDIEIAGTGSPIITGALDAMLGDITVLSGSSSAVTGELDVTLNAISVVGAGAGVVSGGLAIGMGEVAIAATGAPIVTANAAIELGLIALEGEGVVEAHAGLNVLLDDIVLTASGAPVALGEADIALGVIALTTVGSPRITGALAIGLGDIGVDGEGEQIVPSGVTVGNIASSGKINASGASPLSFAITVQSNSNRYLVVAVAGGVNNADYNVTFNGDAMTALHSMDTGEGRFKLFGLIAPDVATGNVVVTPVSGSTSMYSAGAVEMWNVNQSTPAGTVATDSPDTDTTPSVSVTGADGGVSLGIVYAFGADSTPTATPDGGQTELVDRFQARGTFDEHVYLGISSEEGSGTKTFGWTIALDTGLYVTASLGVTINPA
jgi:hypothetical protein